jgi:hypothetical protein
MVGFFLEKLFLDARSPNLTDSTIVELCSVAMVVAENGSMLKATQRVKDWLEKVRVGLRESSYESIHPSRSSAVPCTHIGGIGGRNDSLSNKQAPDWKLMNNKDIRDLDTCIMTEHSCCKISSSIPPL